MEIFQTRFFIFCLFLLGLIAYSNSSTVIVDNVTQWKHPILTIGDSIIFRHKYNYNLYIFRSRMAFNLCNFTQATQLTTPKSPSYTWRASRVGNFYFSFNNGTTDDSCQRGQKLGIKVVTRKTAIAAAPSPLAAAAPPKIAGGAPSSSFPWPFLPHEKSAGAVMSSEAPISTAMGPMLPDGKGGRMPFISSNPAVPIPATEADSTSVFPLPTSAINHSHKHHVRAVDFAGVLIIQYIWSVILL